MPDIVLTLTMDEANLVLESLGNMPYIRVAGVINKVLAQANKQTNEKTEEAGEASAE